MIGDCMDTAKITQGGDPVGHLVCGLPDGHPGLHFDPTDELWWSSHAEIKERNGA
jgi:hypothetical protein